MQAGLYGSDLRVHGSRDFLERQLFILGQDQNLALQRRQRCDRGSDCVGGLAAFQIR